MFVSTKYSKTRLSLHVGFAALAVSSAALAGAPALAQSAAQPQGEGRITGTVVNASGNFLRGAEVRVEGSDIVGVTDSDGRFILQRVPAGTQQLSITYFGYETGRQSVDVGGGATVDITLALKPTATDGSGEIVVSGSRPIAESEEAAIQLKRASTSLVDVIAADSVGRFPDQNIAAAVSRLPGVSIGRDQGQERYISLRGSPASWTTLAFDGVNVISPEGRETRFDTIPSSIASQTVIRKAVTADMPGETVAGNINIVTRSPFDYHGFKGALDGGYGYNDLGQGKQYNVGGFLSDRFANDTLGILIGASRYERDMVTDNFENSWEVSPEDQEPGGKERIWAAKTQNKLYRLTRSNTSFSGRLEWRPDSANQIFLSSIYSQFRDDELRNAWVFDLDQDAKKTSSSTVGTTTGYADIRTGNTPLQGTLHGAEIESTLNSNSSRQSIFTNTLAGEHDLDTWKVKWRLNYTRADARSKPPFQSSWVSPTSFTQRPTLVYDFTDPNLARVHLFQTIRNADGTYSTGPERPYIQPTELNFLNMTRNRQLDRTNAYTGKLDIEHNAALFGAETVIQLGGEYDKRTKTSNRTVLEVTPETLAAAGLTNPTQAQISIDTPYKGKLPLGYGFRYFSSELGEALFDSYAKAGAARIQAGASEENDYRVTEEVLAGYLMGTTYFNWGNIVYGARVERVKNTGSALSMTNDGYLPTQVSNSFTSVYPSIHLNWDVNRDMKLRLSANTGAARPDYDQLRPNFSYDDDEQIVSGGNPNAKPERAKGVDLYFEWYMPSRGFLSVGAYYKDLQDILYDVELPTFGSDILNSNGINRADYHYATIANGGGGHIKGLEFAFSQPLEGLARSMGLPDWAQGFGLQANLTLNDSKATTPDGRTTDLPGASPLIYNVSGYYERYGFSARLSYQWQKAYLDSIGSGDILGDTYWANVARLDFSLRYAINENVQLYLDANNLTNEPGIRYQGDFQHQIEHEVFGRRYLAGVKLNF
ncbi:TonB-dependent receptor [Novosphingobium album (ex Liu et al. 2023)]|uniref:TonB-dependent receptor n=1 Tax=Novosphingobium album (ex Liu et al. 2023) TaxID=3031130 RepID=A0ABT5WW13_9SPHN|nr:TonB-dependent receptor [Novosphingobium album (ex Liu et al. 2023)]MDE8654044.1 TonB-dependent receptor [Novosphingobium album (ex Liu et al. 2023)]